VGREKSARGAKELVEELTNAGPGTQAELARRLSVSSPTVKRAVERLNRANQGSGKNETIYLVPAAEAQLPEVYFKRRGSKSAQVLMIGRNAGRVIGVEIGHGHLCVGVGDANGCLLGSSGRQIAHQDHVIDAVPPHETFFRIAKLVKEQLKASATDPTEIRAVAASLPAPVSVDGKTLSKKLLGNYAEVDIRADLLVALEANAGIASSTPVFIENDADVLARGEHRYGKAFGLRDFAVIKCSGGIGAAVVSNEHVVRGKHGGGAGELGHCFIGPEVLSKERTPVLGRKPRRCRCGGWGHLEAYAGGDALLEQIDELREAPAKRGKRLRTVTLDEVFRRAIKQESPYAEAIGDASALIGVGVGTIVHLFNPELVLLCGKFSELGDLFLDAVHHECREHGFLYGRVAKLVQLGTGGDAAERRRIGVRGAITTALRKSSAPLLYSE
jgi:predicted NBD/HSP70 family sugar kinase